MNRGGRPPKLTSQQVATAREYREFGFRTDEIARRFGVAVTTLRRYLRGHCRQIEERGT